MTFNPEIHHRHSIRLPNYDCSQPGYYFVTLCAHDRECFFGDIENNSIVLNEIGMLVKKKWLGLSVHFPGIELDNMIIMSNHLHGIIIILGNRRGAVVAPPGCGKTLGQMVAWFKYESTKEINRIVSGNPDAKIWQRNFFDRIIRNDEELNRIRDYIVKNPETWKEDENYV
jgi:putative transposase